MITGISLSKSILLICDETEYLFIKDVQYSQGYFDYTTTTNIFEAMDFAGFSIEIIRDGVRNTLSLAIDNLAKLPAKWHLVRWMLTQSATRQEAEPVPI